VLRKLRYFFSALSAGGSENDSLLLSAKIGNRERENDTDFGLRNPLQIGTALRDLAIRQDFLTVESGNQQIVTRLLHVDTKSKTLIFDYGSIGRENRPVLAAHKLLFSASPNGVKIEFTTGMPRKISYDGNAAFEVELPQVLFRMQRRGYFRVETPMFDPYFCSGVLPDGQPFRLEMHDLSLGGVALRTRDENIANLEIGATLKDVVLHLWNQGTVVLDLQLVSPRFATMPKGGKIFILGFRILSLPAYAEKMLQQLITQLEIKRGVLWR
jgi:c-di-GMP-binding flagellar brake protein YcgR